MEFNNWKYLRDKNGFQVIPNEKIEIPRSFVKYYSLSTLNIDAITNQYLYFSHPSILNDPFDGCFQLISLKDFSERQFVKLFFKNKDLLKTHPELTYESLTIFIKNYYQKNKESLIKLGLTFYWNEIFKNHGLLSLTEKDSDLLMWSYYTNHTGFAIKLKNDFLNGESDVIGPFPINYADDYKTICPRSVKLQDEQFLYISNVKSTKWKHENEWRFILNRENMSIPKYKDDNLKDGKRKVNYQKNQIEAIYLGYKFLFGNLSPTYLGENVDLYSFNPDFNNKNDDWLKVQVLNFAIGNRIPIKGIETEEDNSFSLHPVTYEILIKKKDTEYLVERKL